MIPILTWGARVAATTAPLLFPLTEAWATDRAQPVVSPWVSSLQMLLGLGLVLALIAATAWLLRRLAPGQVAGRGDLRVVAAVAVGPKERVVLVDVGETRLVLGVAPGSVTRLHEMPRPAQPDHPAQSSITPPMVSKFKEILAARKEGK
ncbi:MAG: flagellar biosynthetic protein FliO [Methylophilaceae bacterium]|nr:flagellar biosynthetic protein FliO [Methylophilaceae bacterium]